MWRAFPVMMRHGGGVVGWLRFSPSPAWRGRAGFENVFFSVRSCLVPPPNPPPQGEGGLFSESDLLVLCAFYQIEPARAPNRVSALPPIAYFLLPFPSPVWVSLQHRVGFLFFIPPLFLNLVHRIKVALQLKAPAGSRPLKRAVFPRPFWWLQ